MCNLRGGVTIGREFTLLESLIESARTRLAEIEAAYTKDKSAVDHIKATIFNLVREQYQARDRIKLIVEYRRKYLNTIMTEGDDQAEGVAKEYQGARADADANYEKASAAAANQKVLSGEEQDALNLLWRKLVKLFHPDRFAGQPDKEAAYEKLTAAINLARDEGNIELLREIADDPNGFIFRQGWGALDLKDDVEIKALQKLYATLQLEIISRLEMLNTLHESPDYELLTLSQKNSRLLGSIAEDQKKSLSAEISELNDEAVRLKQEIDDLAEVGGDSIA